MASRTGEGEDKIFRSPEGVRLSETAMSAGGEVDAFDSGEGLDVVDCVIPEGSTLWCI